jgi:hypothetical protein
VALSRSRNQPTAERRSWIWLRSARSALSSFGPWKHPWASTSFAVVRSARTIRQRLTSGNSLCNADSCGLVGCSCLADRSRRPSPKPRSVMIPPPQKWPGRTADPASLRVNWGITTFSLYFIRQYRIIYSSPNVSLRVKRLLKKMVVLGVI